jgi:hypothetical protein
VPSDLDVAEVIVTSAQPRGPLNLRVCLVSDDLKLTDEARYGPLGCQVGEVPGDPVGVPEPGYRFYLGVHLLLAVRGLRARAVLSQVMQGRLSGSSPCNGLSWSR